MPERRPVLALRGYTYCASDLHIHAPDASGRFDRMFTQTKADTLATIARLAAKGPGRGQLVLVGDVFDLTGAIEPRNGLIEFFDAVLGPGHGVASVAPRNVRDHLTDVGRAYPDLFKALGELTRHGDLTFLLGNHDCALFEPAAEQTLATFMEVGVQEIHFATEPWERGPYRFEHGHAYDENNNTSNGPNNRGAVITSALYHAVMPALLKLGVAKEVVQGIPAVRPMEAMVDGLEALLGSRTDRFLKAFVRLLADNGYWGDIVPAAILEIIGTIVATVDRVRAEMGGDAASKQALRDHAKALVKAGNLDSRGVIVMGHTHDRDVAENYLNLGTWIDYLPGLTDQALRGMRVELPVLRIAADDTSILFDANGLLTKGDLEGCPQLWSSTAPAAPMGAIVAVADAPLATEFVRAALINPTVQCREADGRDYVETSTPWKQMCRALPCFEAIQWPDYATKVIELEIDGHAVVVQLWKGWCQQFVGRSDFPGGIGAEVGIYRRIPGKPVPSDFSFLPPVLGNLMALGARLGGEKVWWPYPELNTTLTFSLVNPATNQEFFGAGPETTYWLNRWVRLDGYEDYKRAQGGRVPRMHTDYELRYTINGMEHRW